MITHSHRHIDERAADWLARRDSGRWGEAEEREFEAWMAESTLHRVAFLRIERGWEEALRLRALGAGLRSDAPPAPGRFFKTEEASTLHPLASRLADSPENSRSGAFPRRLAVAACLVLAAGAAFYVLSERLQRSSDFSTPVGGVASVPMPDGSRVTLNTDSRLRLAINEVERTVELKQGEAFFEVAKDPKRPFIVMAGDKRVIAVGTSFSVRRVADDVKVIVTEGRVRVETRGSAPQTLAEPLGAGSVANMVGERVVLQAKPLQETEELLSWRTGVLVFRDTTLAEAVDEFNRYNTLKITIQSSALADYHIGGSFRSTKPEAFVRVLEQGYPLRVEYRADEIVLASE